MENKKISSIRGGPGADEGDEWLLTYSDMVTLLLCFFVVLIGISKIDLIKVEQMTQQYTKSDKITMTELSKMIEDFVKQENLQNQMDVQLTSRGVEVNLKDKLLFDIGKAELKANSLQVMSKISELINYKDIADRLISIEGHTDSLPIKSEKYPSNWELSSARAASVVRYFISLGMISGKFESVGYADTIPRNPSSDEQTGQPENRRVVIVIKPESYLNR